MKICNTENEIKYYLPLIYDKKWNMLNSAVAFNHKPLFYGTHFFRSARWLLSKTENTTRNIFFSQFKYNFSILNVLPLHPLFQELTFLMWSLLVSFCTWFIAWSINISTVEQKQWTSQDIHRFTEAGKLLKQIIIS